MSLALRVNKWLLSEDKGGNMLPPGGGRALKWPMPDGSQGAIACRGDGFDLYVMRGGQILNLPITIEGAKQLRRFLFRWWVFGTWCGIKLWLWRWSLSRIVGKG